MIIRNLKLRLCMSTMALIALTAAAPLLAGWAGDSGAGGGIAWQVCRGDFTSWLWSGGAGSPTYHTDTCYPYGGTISCSGSMKRTLTWNGGLPPQTPVLIREIAGAVATSSDGGAHFTVNSLGPQSGNESVVRYTWVDGSLGTISRTISASATASCGLSGTAQASVTYTSLDVVDSYPGATVDKTHVENPRNTSSQPWWPGKPCQNHNHGGNASNGDPVNLATGEHLYVPEADLFVYNPYGPSVSYQRNFFSKIAKEGGNSPGLPIGWIDGYDVKIHSTNPSGWNNLELIYSNSAVEASFVPDLQPTEFTEPAGCDLYV